MDNPIDGTDVKLGRGFMSADKLEEMDIGDGDKPRPAFISANYRCLNLSTSIGGTRCKVEGGDHHDLEPEGMREDTRHKIYTGSSSQSSYPTSCLEYIAPCAWCCSSEGLCMFS
jgi:hypothetical protein